jgi:hypothetical protein
MNNNDEIQKELLQISKTLTKVGDANLWECPEKYFDQLADEINFKIRLGDAGKKVIATSEESTYFESFAEKLLEKITIAEEQNELSAELKSTLNKPVFEIPYNYFNNLDEAIIANKSTPAERIYPTKIFSIKNIAFAAAAMVAILMTISMLRWAKISDSSNVQLAQLEESIQAGIKMDGSKFNQTIEKLTEADIILYLEENSTETDVATIENLVNEETLPNEEDYFINEKTIDEYLDKTKTSSSN